MFLLVALIALAYSSIFANSFVDYDDPAYITGNPHVRAGLTADTMVWAWKSYQEAGFWHPLTWISHAADVELFGLNPAGHHFTSFFIHVLNAVLLFTLLSCLNPNRSRCFVAAALFGLHPLAVESVSWAAERKNVLCTLFFLLAIAAYGRYARRPTLIRYLWLVMAFLCGLASKPMVVTLPFVFLLLDFWPLARVQGYSSVGALNSIPQLKLKQLVLEKLPLLALSVGTMIVTLGTQSAAGAVASTSVVPLTARVWNALNSYFVYVLTALWPVNLAPFYPEVAIPAWRIGLAALFVLTVTVAVWFCRLKRPYLIFGWLFYLGTLVPVIGIVQAGTQARADRFTYIPMIGVFVALVWLCSDAFSSYMTRRTQVLASAALLTALAVLTWRQVRLWHDDVTLWSYDLNVVDDNVVAEDNLGIALVRQGRVADALSHFYRAARLDPTDPISAVNVATDLLSRGHLKEAVARYQSALMENRAANVPMLVPTIHSNLGSALLGLGEIEQARDQYEVALRLNPEDQIARSGLLKIEGRLGMIAAHQ